jgi:hypothetical protein
VFLVSIQEVIKNPRDFCVTSSSKAQPEPANAALFTSQEDEQRTTHSKIVSLSTPSKRSRRKRLLTKAHQPLVNLDVSGPSSVETEDGFSMCYDEVQVKKHKPNQPETYYCEENDISNEPLSLVVRKSPCDSKGETASDSHSDVMPVVQQTTLDNDVDAYPTDLRVRLEDNSHPDEIQKDSLSQQNSINKPPFAENCDDTQETHKEINNAKPEFKPKSNHRKSKTKPKRILPLDRTNYNENYDNQSISSPSGSHSPSCEPSLGSEQEAATPDHHNKSNDKHEPKELTREETFSVNSANPASFTNVYESGTPASSPALSIPKKEPLDPGEKFFENLLPGAAGNPWSMVFDPESHSKWLQSIAAYVQTPINTTAMVPPMAHQGLPFVGGTLPSPKLSLPLLSKPQVFIQFSK